MQKGNIINALALFIILNIVTEFLYYIEASSSNWCLLNGNSNGCPSIGNFLYSNSTYRSPHIVRYVCVLLSESKMVRERDAKGIFSNLQNFPDSSNLPFTFVEYYENLGTFVFEIKSQESTNENRDLYPLINGLKKIGKNNILNKSDCTKESMLTDLSVFAGRGSEKIHTNGQTKLQGFWNNPTFGRHEERILYSDSSFSHKENESLRKSLDDKNGELSLYKELDYYILDRFSKISHILQASPMNIDILQNSSIFNALDFLKILNQSPKSNLVMQQNNSSITQYDQELRWGMSPFYNLNLENTNYTNVAHKVWNQTTPLTTSDIKSNSIDYSGDIGTVLATAIFQGMADSSSQLPPPFGNPTSGSGTVNQIKSTETGNNISKEHFPTLTNWSYKPIPQGIKTNNNNHQNQNSKPNLSISSFDSPSTSNTVSSPVITSGSGLSPSAFESIDKWSKVDSQTPPVGLQLTQSRSFLEFKSPSSSPSSSPSTAEWMRRTVSRQNDNGRLFSSGNTGITNQNFSSPLVRASRLSNTQFGYFDPANRGSKQGVTFVRMNGSVFDDPNDITSFHPESFLEKLPEEVLSNMTQQQKDKVNLINAFIGTGFDVLLQMNGVAGTNSNNKSGSTKNSDGKTGNGIFSFRKLHQSDMSVRNFESLLRNIDTNQGQDTAMAYVAGCDCNRFPDGVVCPLVLSGDVSIECIGYKVWDSAQKGAPLSDVVSAIDSAVVAKAQNIVFPLRFSQDTIEKNRAAPRVLRHIMRRTSKDHNILFALPTGNDGMQSVEDHVDFPCDDITGMYAFCVGSINATTGLPSEFTNIPYITTIFANGENVESFALNQQKQLFSGTGMALAQSIGTINIIQGITKNKVSIFDQLAILHSTPKKLPSRSFLNQLITNSEPAPVRQVKQSQLEVLNDSFSSSFQSKSQNSLANNQYNKSNIFTGFLNESNEDRNDTIKEEDTELNDSSSSTIDIFGDDAGEQANTFEPNSITKKLSNEIRLDNPINSTILEIKNIKKSSENNKNLRSEPDASLYEKDSLSIIDHFNKYNSSDHNSISYNDDDSKESIDKYNLKINYSEDDIPYESRNYGPEILGVVLDPPNIAEVSKFIEMSNKVADHEISYNDSEFDYIDKIPAKSLCYEEETRYYSPMEMVLPVDNIEQCILACSNTPECRFYSYGAFLKTPTKITGTCILMPDKQGSVSLHNFQSGTIGCPVSASIAYAEAMEERLINGIHNVNKNIQYEKGSNSLRSEEWPGILTTSASAVRSMGGFLSRFPLNDLIQTSISLYNSGFLDQKGALRPSSAIEKQSVLPPPGVGLPHVICTSEGMQCCVPQKSAKGWRKRAPSFIRVNDPSCEAIYVSKTDMFCATTSLYDNSSSGPSGNCGMVIIETSEHLIFQNTLRMPSKEMNNALCECKLNKRDKSIHGSGTWEYSVQAVQTALNNKVEGEQLSTGVAQALAWVEAVGNDPNPTVNGLGELISQVAQRPGSDVELITQIPAISQNAVANMLQNQQYQQQKQYQQYQHSHQSNYPNTYNSTHTPSSSNRGLLPISQYKSSLRKLVVSYLPFNISNDSYPILSSILNIKNKQSVTSKCLTSWPEKCQVWRSICEDNLKYSYKNPRCIPITILENGCPMREVGFKINDVDSGLLSFSFKPMRFVDNAKFRIACQFKLINCSLATLSHYCNTKNLGSNKKQREENLRSSTIAQNNNELLNSTDKLNLVSTNYIPYIPPEGVNLTDSTSIENKYIRVYFPQAGEESNITLVQYYNNQTKRNFAAKIINIEDIPQSANVEEIFVDKDTNFQYLGKVEIIPNFNDNDEVNKAEGSVESTKNINEENYTLEEDFKKVLQNEHYEDNDDIPLLLDKYQPDITGKSYPEFEMKQVIIEIPYDSNASNEDDFYTFTSSLQKKRWSFTRNFNKEKSSNSQSNYSSKYNSFYIFLYLITTLILFIVAG